MSYTIVLRLIGLASLLAIAGCEVKTYTDTVPVSGGLHTPEGIVPFKRVESKKLAERLGLNVRGHWSTHSFLFSNGGTSQIIFNPLSSISSVQIISPKDGEKIFIDIDNAYYQINNNQREKWTIPLSNTRGNIGQFLYQQKATKYYYVGIDVPLINFNEKYDHTFRYYLPYTLDDKPYLLDVTVEFKKNYDIELNISFPGSP